MHTEKNRKKVAYSNPFLPEPSTQFRQNLEKLKEQNRFAKLISIYPLYGTLTYKNKIQSQNKLWWKKQTYHHYHLLDIIPMPSLMYIGFKS